MFQFWTVLSLAINKELVLVSKEQWHRMGEPGMSQSLESKDLSHSWFDKGHSMPLDLSE